MNSQALPYILLLGLIWGSNLVVARFGLGQFNPLVFVGLRLLLASLAHLAVYVVGRRPWPAGRALWWRATLLGVLGTALPMTATIGSLRYLSSGMTAVLIAASPAVTVLMAHAFLGDERLTRRTSLGVALSLGGALLLALRGESGLPDVGQAAPFGFGLVALGILSGTAMTIYARAHLRDYGAFDVATVRMWVATLTVLPLAALLVGLDLSGVNREGYLSLAYTAYAGAFAGLLLEFAVIKRFGATAVAMTTYVIPVFATLGGALFLAEIVTAPMLVGMALIVAGIAVINRRPAATAVPGPIVP